MATALSQLGAAGQPGAAAPRGFAHKLPRLLLWVFFAAPVAGGVAGTLLPAFGYLPALGGRSLTLEPWRELAHVPGLARAVLLSLGTGLATAALSFAMVVGLAAHWHGTRSFALARRLLSPLLSVPAVALAIGFAFLIAPSGWVFRLLAATGLAGPLPPDLATVQDPWGVALVLGLMLKEVPFLLLMLLVALGQIRLKETLTVARALGHRPAAAWLAAVLPQIYPQLRLPLYAVLAYSVSAVDVALVLGPTAPPSLAVLLWRGFQSPDLAERFWASAGACLQLGIAAAAILLWRLGEAGIAALGRRRIAAGWHGSGRPGGAAMGLLAIGALIATAIASLAGIALWSLASRWPASAPLPSAITLSNWGRQLGPARQSIMTTAGIGAASALAALALTVALLEAEKRAGASAGRLQGWVLYAPLLLPQIGFLFGLQVLLVEAGLDGTWVGLAWAHFLFVLPYVYLSLAEPWRALDPRFERTALCLGHGRAWVSLTITLPMLGRPLLIALALGFAVSIGQYLPTLFAGAGRFATVTTEAVTLAAGGDRRVVGVYAGLQTALPALGFALAALLGRTQRLRGAAG